MSNAPQSGPPNGGPPNGLTEAQAQRLEELLDDRAVFGLDSIEEADELKRLLAAAGPDHEQTSDLVAAAVAAAELSIDQSPPHALRERVLRDPIPSGAPTRPETITPPLEDSATDPGRMSWKAVAMAVAAGLLISLMINNLRPAPSLSDQRMALIESADDLTRVAWSPQEDASLTVGLEGDAAYGDVVWSDKSQSGYMRFRGLKPNDPTVEQYQLWIFDEARNAEHPVDGGVFDLAAADGNEAGETVVPINTKLPITKATLFAITVEKPGGVVVSDRSRLPLLAQR